MWTVIVSLHPCFCICCLRLPQPVAACGELVGEQVQCASRQKKLLLLKLKLLVCIAYAEMCVKLLAMDATESVV